MVHTPSPLSTVILLAHGPASETLTAARRLESLVDDRSQIIVVEATPPGATAVDRARDRGYTVADISGDALATIVEGLDGSILVVHDDVLIDEPSVRALSDAHQSSGKVAIPPTSGDTADVDLVCAVGSATQLAGLAKRAGFGPGMRLVDEFSRPTSATFSHVGSCQQRTTDPRDLDRPLIVAGLIVRDEEDNISECLESLQHVVDRIEVVDTGSADRTVEIARSLGANVTEIEWRNDFAWARNHVLEACRDAVYTIWIDGDERFECDDPRGFRTLLATYHRIYPSYAVPLRNFRSDGVETHSFTARRIANPSVVEFRGAIHEQVVSLDGTDLVTALLTNVSIRHLGYDEDVVDLGSKMERNLEVARAGFDSDPSDTNAVQLARALRGASTNANDTLAEIEPLQRSLVDSSATIRAVMHGLTAELLLEAKRVDEAIDAAKATLELVPADAAAGAVLAECLRLTDRPDEIVLTANDYEQRPSSQPLFDDHVAKQTRARIVFEAALRIGDVDTACTHASALPPELDPWPILASRLATDELLAMVPAAAVTDDGRIVAALASRPDLNRKSLRVLDDNFGASPTRATQQLLAEIRDDLNTVDAHGERRATFERSGQLEDVVRYAESACAGQSDLCLELDDLVSQHDPIAAALAVAAEAHLRRGDTQAAETDADESLTRWNGCTRAVVVAATVALASEDAARALTVIDAARSAEHADRPTRDRRHAMCRLATRAHLEVGNIPAAVADAAEIVEEAGELQLWERLLHDTSDNMEATTLVLGLALLGDGVEFVDALAASATPSRTGQLCATYLALGGDNPDAVSTGILAAVMTGLHDLAVVIAGYGHLLPDEIRDRLADHLAEVPAIEVANQLRENITAAAS